MKSCSWTWRHAGRAVLAALALSFGGGGQAEETTTAAETPAPVPLTRDGALLSAMTFNRGVEVARYGPRIAATLPREARAEFDPVLLGTVSFGRDTRPDLNDSRTSVIANPLAGGTDTVADAAALVTSIARLDAALEGDDVPDVRTDTTAGALTLSNRLPTGTQVFLTGEMALDEIAPGSDRNTGDLTLGVSQPLLKGAGRKANLVALRQARNLEAQSDEAFRRALLATAHDVESAYWALVLADEVMKIREFGVSLAAQQVKRTQDFREVGKAILGDVMSTQAEEATRRAELATARGEREKRNIDLVRLMNPEGSQNWDTQFSPQDPAEVTKVETNGAESAHAALENRPELKEAGFDVANLALDVDLERNNRLPRLDLVGSYGRYSAGNHGGDNTRDWGSGRYEHYSVGLELEFPLVGRAEKARLQRARLANARGEAAVRQLEEAVAAQARQAEVGVRQEWERLEATKAAVEGRREELRIAQGRYEVGKVTNLDLLQVQRDLVQAQVDEITARVGYLQALTQLYAAEGTLLDRRGITVAQYVEEK